MKEILKYLIIVTVVAVVFGSNLYFLKQYGNRPPPQINSVAGLPVELREKLDDPSALPEELRALLLRSFSKKASGRMTAVFKIGEMGAAAAPAVPYLVLLLDNTSTEPGNPHFADGETLGKEAAAALRRIGPAATDAVLAAVNQGRFLPDALAALPRDPRSVDALMQRLSRSGKYKVEILHALGEQGDSRARDLVVRSVGSFNPRVKLAAVTALGKMADIWDVSILEHQLRQRLYPAVRAAAAEALGHVESGRAVDVLIGALNDRNKAVVLQVIRALGKIGDRRAIAPLTAKVPSLNAKTLPAAFNALADLGAVEQLERFYDTGDAAQRLAVATALGRRKDGKAVDVLIKILVDGDESVVHAAITGLGRAGGPRAASALTERISYFKPGNRAAAFNALARMGAGDDLLSLLGTGDPDQRTAVVAALGRVRGKKALDAVIGALDDPEKEVRAAAARALAGIDDVRAVEGLLYYARRKLENRKKERQTLLNISLLLRKNGDDACMEKVLGLLNDPDARSRVQAKEVLIFLSHSTVDYGYDRQKWREWWEAHRPVHGR